MADDDFQAKFLACVDRYSKLLEEADLARKRVKQLEMLLTIGYDLLVESQSDTKQYDFDTRCKHFIERVMAELK